MNDLDARLLAAHVKQDQSALVTLYREAAEQATDKDAAGFFLTHAYVYALVLDHPLLPVLTEQLARDGRI